MNLDKRILVMLYESGHLSISDFINYVGYPRGAPCEIDNCIKSLTHLIQKGLISIATEHDTTGEQWTLTNNEKALEILKTIVQYLHLTATEGGYWPLDDSIKECELSLTESGYVAVDIILYEYGIPRREYGLYEF